jgi:Ca-activated chloride channel family protein
MKRRTAISNIAVAGAVFLLSPTLQTLAREDEPGFVIRSDVRLVLLDVSVKDKDGDFITGLTANNFHVNENGRPQPITVFANNDIPVTVGILVDNSRSMTLKRAEVLSAANSFIQGSNPQDEVFVLNFNETVKRGLPKGVLFSDNRKQLQKALSLGIPEGRTALNDAILEGLQQLELGKRDKKTLVVISDGGDNASVHTEREMFSAVEHSVATIYAIGLFDLEDPDRNPGELKKLARITGGQAYFPGDSDKLIEVCLGIAKDIRTRYTIGYQPKAENGGTLRHLRVQVSAPGRPHLIARTRSSYFYNETPGHDSGP